MSDDGPSVAVCIFGELRCVQVDIYYANLIDPLKADVFIVAQRHFPDDEERISKFTRNVIHAELYDKPNSDLEFSAGLPALKMKRDNFKVDSNLQQYINWRRLYTVLSDCKQKQYSYYVIIRSDYHMLFPFPPMEVLDKVLATEFVGCYKGHEFGGINTTMTVIPQKHLETFCTAPYETIMGNNPKMPNLRRPIYNIESFIKTIFEHFSIQIKKISPNAFITAESLGARTTWGPIYRDNNHNILAKYPEQVKHAYMSLSRYNKSQKWFEKQDRKEHIIDV